MHPECKSVMLLEDIARYAICCACQMSATHPRQADVICCQVAWKGQGGLESYVTLLAITSRYAYDRCTQIQVAISACETAEVSRSRQLYL